MADPINRKLSSKAVEKDYLLDFVNKELVPVVERLRLALAAFASQIKSGNGSPEGSVTASPGVFYQRLDGTLGSILYWKQTGDGDTGWTAVL